jgi:uncharacterized protein
MQGTLEKTESREWIMVDNNGVRLLGILHRPIQKENPPIVVILHGFASSKLGSNRCYVALAEALAKTGIAALRFDFRGSGDSESSLDEASFEDLISDALAVFEHITSLERINASRFGLFGASLGGAIGVEVSARWKKTKALALWAPVASGELWFRDFILKRPELMQAPDPLALIGTYRGINLTPAFREQFARLFAYKTLAAMPQVPVLHMHGEKDDTISIAHQEAFKTCRSNAKFITYPEEQHSLGYAVVFPEILQETLAFFAEHL